MAKINADDKYILCIGFIISHTAEYLQYLQHFGSTLLCIKSIIQAWQASMLRSQRSMTRSDGTLTFMDWLIFEAMLFYLFDFGWKRPQHPIEFGAGDSSKDWSLGMHYLGVDFHLCWKCDSTRWWAQGTRPWFGPTQCPKRCQNIFWIVIP